MPPQVSGSPPVLGGARSLPGAALRGPPKPPRSPSPLPRLESPRDEKTDHAGLPADGDALDMAGGRQREKRDRVDDPAETERQSHHLIDEHQLLASGLPDEVEFYHEERRASMPVEAIERPTPEDPDLRRSSEPQLRLKWPQVVELARRRGRQSHDLRRQIVGRRSGSRSPFRWPRRESGAHEPESEERGPESGGPGSSRSRPSSSRTSRSSSRGQVKKRGESDSETDSESFGAAIFQKLTIVAGRKRHSSKETEEDDNNTPGKSASFSLPFVIGYSLCLIPGEIQWNLASKQRTG